MNALRPFTPDEIAGWGGPQAFLPQCWQSVSMYANPAVYAAPWAAYTFVICYRRDLLTRAGVSEEGAFASPAALADTLRRLQEAGIQAPWSVPVDPSDLDVLHLLASWVWGAGGELTGPDGCLLCREPKALAALQTYFEILKSFSSGAYPFSANEAVECFTTGQAAVTLCGADLPYAWLRNRSAAPEVCEHLGVALVPGVPWIGGDNLVLWQHTRLQLEREKATVALVHTLLDLPAQQAQAAGEEFFLPARTEALAALPDPESQLTRAVIESLRNGRAYQSMPMWSKIEHRFGLTLTQIGQDVLGGADARETIHKHLDALANRLEITLRGT
jgi:ABC-type glycerol-3-phosphate transport system substrate-binding protein